MSLGSNERRGLNPLPSLGSGPVTDFDSLYIRSQKEAAELFKLRTQHFEEQLCKKDAEVQNIFFTFPADFLLQLTVLQERMAKLKEDFIFNIQLLSCHPSLTDSAPTFLQMIGIWNWIGMKKRSKRSKS